MAADPRRSRPFKAKRSGQCADGGPQCGNIHEGDIIVRRSTPALFDRPMRGYRFDTSPYYKLWFSHLKCYEQSEAERLQRENVQSRTEPEES